jgi:hypothetical protein
MSAMTKFSRATFRATGYGVEHWSADRSPVLRVEFFACRIIFSLALLAFSPSGAAAASKDPTLRGADASSHTVHWTKSHHLGTSKGGHGVSANSQAQTVKLDSQLKQLENNTIKAPNGKQVQAKSSNRREPSRALTSRGDKINLRTSPRQKSGVSNQLGEGSGTRRYGPGRRVTEKSP